ncbi:MAG: FGGY family carbohydrate kinase [Chloroflexi bacterium]|nr:FGGY family carbohydrate kinase [Chloroflexota bacterium]MCL5075686.1 FGGY family carbohydrate kinase [Chloroflexota bacterium]
MPVYLLGIDIGGTGCKTTLYTKAGEEVASAYREYQMESRRVGWAEEDPDEWWRATALTIRDILNRPDVVPQDIAGIGVSCTNALVAVDDQGTPLRPAIMLWDQRATSQVDWLTQNVGIELILGIAGNNIGPGTFSLPSILWIKEHEPEIFARTSKFLVPTGFIVHRLTGQFTIDFSRASTTLLFDIKNLCWSEQICQATGVPLAKLPSLYPSTDIVGTVTNATALDTGLLAGTPVIAGCMDTVSAALAMGAIESNQSFIIMGTAARLAACLSRPTFDHHFLNCVYAQPGLWLTIAAINGAGTSLRWFRDTFGQLECVLAREIGADPYDLLCQEAAQSSSGAHGVIYLPYIAAERSPIWDPYARGVFLGLALAHKRSDIIRAILEGVAYAVKHNLEIFESELGIRVPLLRIGGGGARSAIWRGIIGDVTNRQTVYCAVKDPETLGAAVLAGVGAGLYENLEDGVRQSVRTAEETWPSQAAQAIYAEGFELYKDIYKALKPYFKLLSEAQASRG